MKLAIAQKMIRQAYQIAVILLALMALSWVVSMVLFVKSADLQQRCLSALYFEAVQKAFYAFDL